MKRTGNNITGYQILCRTKEKKLTPFSKVKEIKTEDKKIDELNKAERNLPHRVSK